MKYNNSADHKVHDKDERHVPVLRIQVVRSPDSDERIVYVCALFLLLGLLMPEMHMHLMLVLLLALISHVDSSDSRQDIHHSVADGNCPSTKNEELRGLITSGANNEETSCGIWFAKSSIPNSGLGIYAGRTFDQGEHMMASGDIVIPMVDMEMHQGEQYFSLLDSYTWSMSGLENDGLNVVHFMNPGLGAATNGFPDLHNIEELTK